MLLVLAILAAIGVVFLIVPAVTTSVSRSVIQALNSRTASGSIDQEMVEARLGRIEEAIDAMALQIERLTDQQRALLAHPSDSFPRPIEDQSRTEPPR